MATAMVHQFWVFVVASSSRYGQTHLTWSIRRTTHRCAGRLWGHSTLWHQPWRKRWHEGLGKACYESCLIYMLGRFAFSGKLGRWANWLPTTKTLACSKKGWRWLFWLEFQLDSTVNQFTNLEHAEKNRNSNHAWVLEIIHWGGWQTFWSAFIYLHDWPLEAIWWSEKLQKIQPI